MPRLILASASPRRRELLEQIGVKVVVQPADIDESVIPAESPQSYVRRLALAKARRGYQLGRASLPALGSDTSVVVDDQILGKPASLEEAREMLMRLSGREHQVLTGVALVSDQGEQSRVVCTRVWFKSLTLDEIDSYWHSGEPCDKAGGYGIQGKGAVFVTRIEGSYSAVVGLPLAETADLLSSIGVAIWND